MSSIRVLRDLTVTVAGTRTVTLTPSEALTLAESLIRRGTYRMMVEEALKPPPAVRRSSVRGRVVQ
jgi:hypothetical protein